VLLAVSQQVPGDLVEKQAWAVHQGVCPVCGGPGPNDVYVSYQVWSAVIVTRHTTRRWVSCRNCGRKGQIDDLGLCFVLGWWGLPWGIVMTPIQIGRNLAALAKKRDLSSPSPELQGILRVAIASQALASQASSDDAEPTA